LVTLGTLAWLICAALTFAASLLALVIRVRRVRWLPLPLATTVAFSLLVCFDALLLNALSRFHAVTREGVLIGHALLLAGALGRSPRANARHTQRILCALRPRVDLRLLVLLALLVPIAASAARYAPNNWDSMTYHLARVAHWIQHRSVAPYPTGNVRQLILSPGAEYLLLVLQVVSGSDRLANSLQLVCYVMVALSAPPLARLAGAPARLAKWAWIVPAAAPMAVLQASSTQNDLVASAVAVAIGAASLTYLHPRTRRTGPAGSGVLLGAAIAAAALVKPTAVLAGAPFIVFGLAAAAARILRRPGCSRAIAREALIAAAVTALVLAPELARRNALSHAPEHVALFSYPILGEWRDRAMNVARGLFRDLPPLRELVEVLSPFPHRLCHTDDRFCTLALRAHEDYAGNPLQAVLVIVALVITAIRWRRVSSRGRHAMTGIACAWVLLHLLLRDNEWISRLHLPLLALSPAFLSAFAVVTRRDAGRRWLRPFAAACGAALLAHGHHAATHNESRLPFFPRVLTYVASYYGDRTDIRQEHGEVLRLLEELGCRRLGLFIGGDSYDYPLTWRAMQLGIEVRHVQGRDPWPCLIFSDRGLPPLAPDVSWETVGWRLDTGGGRAPMLFARSPPAR
jgi:hypothetical protein